MNRQATDPTLAVIADLEVKMRANHERFSRLWERYKAGENVSYVLATVARRHAELIAMAREWVD